MRNLLRDFRYSIRTLLKNPGFTAIVVVTLALGIGANSVIFTFINAILIQPLPWKDAGRIVVVDSSNPEKNVFKGRVSLADFLDWQVQNQVFEHITATWPMLWNITGDGEAQMYHGYYMTSGMSRVLGVNPMIGRDFLPAEERKGGDAVVVLYYNLWRNRYGADPGIIGKKILFDEYPYTVVGVMPPGFRFSNRESQILLPMGLDPSKPGSRSGRGARVWARLKPGVTIKQAEAEMNVIARRLAKQYPDTNKGWGVTVTPAREFTAGPIRPSLLLLLAAVGFVLLIACANVTNLMLARAAVREKEIAVCSALGAARRHMFSRMLAESVVLAGFGGALGLALAYGGVRFLVARLPDPGSRGNAIIQLDFVGIDGWVLGFTLAISVLTALLVGLAPAWKASRPDLNEALKDVRTSLASGQRGRRVHNLLVIGEVAVALVLVVGAALMVQSLVRLNGVSPGFRKEDVLTLTTQFNWSKFRDWKKVYASQRELLESIERLPGVRSAAATARLPMGGWYQWGYFRVKDRAPTSPSDRPREIYDVVTPKFFLTAGIPLLKGRDFDYSDTDERPPVAIINDEVARRYFPNEDSVGKYIEITGRKTVAYEIVGVVGSVRNQGLHEPPVPVLYFPHTQWGGISLVLLVRTTSDPMSLVPSVRAAIRRQDSSAPLYKISTLENLVADSTWDRRFTVLVLSSLAGLALMLALVGVYGVVQYSVTRQTREIGVRIALGAHPRDVLRLVVGRGFKLATLGVAVGLAASLALTRVISSQLYGIKATDLATYTVVSVLLVAVAVLASYLPARRATRVDPIVALRYE